MSDADSPPTEPSTDAPTAADAVPAAATRSRPRSRLGAPTARGLLLAAAIGGILAAAIASWVPGAATSGSSESGWTTMPAPVTTAAVTPGDVDAATAGTCLTWSDPEDMTAVDCAEPHLFEVVAAVDLAVYPGSEFGPAGAMPDATRFRELRTAECVPAAESYLGGRLDPYGRFVVSLIYPAESGWAAGQRTIRCGLQRSGVDGARLSVTGSAARTDQSATFDAGTCVGINAGVPADPVDCAAPHAFEVTGVISLAGEFPQDHPAPDAQDSFLEDRCREVSTDYLGGANAARDKDLAIFWDTLRSESWLAGSRQVNCSVGNHAEGTGFAPITGSAKGEILINGVPPVRQPDPSPVYPSLGASTPGSRAPGAGGGTGTGTGTGN